MNARETTSVAFENTSERQRSSPVSSQSFSLNPSPSTPPVVTPQATSPCTGQLPHSSVNANDSVAPIMHAQAFLPSTLPAVGYQGVQIPAPFNSQLSGTYNQFMTIPLTRGPGYNMFGNSSGLPCMPYNAQPQYGYSSFIPLAPKTPQDEQAKKTEPKHGPPNLIETVKEIRAQLYEMAGISECEEPPTEGTHYSKWRRAVTEAWKPVSQFRYITFNGVCFVYGEGRPVCKVSTSC